MKSSKNLDPFKRSILFIASFIGVSFMSVAFAYVWYRYYSGTMFVVTFYRRGHYAVIGIYFLMLFFFSNMYGGLKIGQLKRTEVVLSQFLSLFLTNFFAYLIIDLLAFRIVDPTRLILTMLVQMVFATIWEVFTTSVYNRIFKPWKMLLIYGERPAADLVYKVDERRDKYAIYEAINIDEGMEKIAEKINEYQAVIIGDISAIKRNDILKYCYTHQIRAYVVPKLSDIILMGADRIHVFDSPFLLTKGYALSFDERVIKRFIDIVLSLMLTIVSSPIMLITAIVIKLYDGGPVFYKQVRVTRGDKEYYIYKFRSMIVNAESDGVAKLATKGDSRITPVGKFIRATRIDELPQLFNILNGDMSFVGPRPERPEIIKEYEKEMPEFSFRSRVKAGLTGFAQVYGKYNTTPYDKLKLDLFYIENYSVWLDLKLIMMTVKIVLKKEATEGIEQGSITAEKESAEIDVNEAIKDLTESNKDF